MYLPRSIKVLPQVAYRIKYMKQLEPCIKWFFLFWLKNTGAFYDIIFL